MSKTTRPIYASDTYEWNHCARLAWFLFHPPMGVPIEPDRFGQLIKTMGEEHEAAILNTFEDPVKAESLEHTQALITENTPVIYQPQFFDEIRGIKGTPDFLLLTADGYHVADAKLAMSVEKNRSIRTQLGLYQQVSNTQLPPIVFLGDGDAVALDEDINLLAVQFVEEMVALAQQEDMPDTHFGFSKCQGCQFQAYCTQGFEQRDEISLSPAIDARTAVQLSLQGFHTLSDLAQARPQEIAEAPYLRNAEKRQRLISQALSLKSAAVIVRKAPLWPAQTMMHFDVEADPMAADGAGEVYLWGLLAPPYGAEAYQPVWRETDDADTWQAFLTTMEKYRARHPDLLLVHYSHYERVQIEHYAARYSAFDDPTVRWLLAEDGPLWDLQHFLKLHYILPTRSYGLKAVCQDPNLANFQWRLQESGSQWSVVRYYDYVAAMAGGEITEAAEIRNEIMLYNEDDVRATVGVVDWLHTFD